MAAALPIACSDKVNHPALLAAGIPCHASRTNCVGAVAHPGGPFSVCDTCATDTNGGGRVQAIIGRLNNVAKPHLLNPDGTVRQARNTGFRTLLCNHCSDREKQLRKARYNGVAPPEYVIPWAERRFMRRYPHDTCKCWQKLFRQDRPRRRSHRHCFNCRMNTCDEIENSRDNNETWLENTARDDAYNTIGVRVATRRRRNNEGTFRACRCGSNVDDLYGTPPGQMGPQLLPGLYQCLSCEGITHIGGVLGGLGTFQPRKHNRRFSLGRARGRGRA